MTKETKKYEEMVAQLEDIVTRMERGDMDIDSLCSELKTAQRLVRQCRDRLTKTDEEVKKILQANK